MPRRPAVKVEDRMDAHDRSRTCVVVGASGPVANGRHDRAGAHPNIATTRLRWAVETATR